MKYNPYFYKRIIEQMNNEVTEEILILEITESDLNKILSSTDITKASSFFAKDSSGKEYTIKIFLDPTNIMKTDAELSNTSSNKFVLPIDEDLAKLIKLNLDKQKSFITGPLRDINDPNRYAIIRPNTLVKLELRILSEKNEINESQLLLTFDEYLIQESNKNWISNINMKKGALKKQMNKDKITMNDLKKEEKKLKNKDKDKDKPGLQLNKNDLKKYKRITLAKTLMNLHESKDYTNSKKQLIELHKIVKDMIEKTSNIEKKNKNMK